MDTREKIVIEKVKPENKPVYEFIKRVFDVIASLCAIIVLAIPMGIIALVIKLDSPGKAIYVQERLGKNQKPFKVYKFRSMREDAEENGAQWAVENDTRVTKVGAFIRKVRLDELPQLFCILKGDMSIVGPRPERAFFYDKFDGYIDGFRQRTYVMPGLTGLAQVNGGYELKPEEKILYDVEYIKNRSLLLDIKIIIKTVAVVFTHNGAY